MVPGHETCSQIPALGNLQLGQCEYRWRFISARKASGDLMAWVKASQGNDVSAMIGTTRKGPKGGFG